MRSLTAAPPPVPPCGKWKAFQLAAGIPGSAAEVGNKAYGTDRPYMINVASARDVIGQVIVTAIEGGDVQAAADTANADFQKLLDEEK